MDDTEIPTQTIDGRKVKVSLLGGTGEFYADLDGHSFKADTLKALLEKLRRAMRTSKTRIAIEASLLFTGRTNSWDTDDSKEPRAEPIIITGIHGGTGSILLTRANGDKETSRAYRSGTFARRLTEDEAKTWVALCKALRAATAAKDKFEAEVKIKDPDKFVTAAVAKAAGTADVVEAEE